MGWWLNGRSAEDAPPDAGLTDCRIQCVASGTAAGSVCRQCEQLHLLTLQDDRLNNLSGHLLVKKVLVTIQIQSGGDDRLSNVSGDLLVKKEKLTIQFN